MGSRLEELERATEGTSYMGICKIRNKPFLLFCSELVSPSCVFFQPNEGAV